MHLPNETPIPIEADHRGMCKFLTSDDNNYRTVSEYIMELVDSLVENLHYRRLDNVNYEIRILTILAESASQDIRATLEHISLIDADAYTALSYCWENPKITAPIYIDDVQVEVTLNLKAALPQLRSRGYGRVWIDAVCINQADEEERSLQVRNMRQIFSRPDQVICWVGESSPEAAEAAHKEFQNSSKGPSEGSKKRSPNLDVLVDFFSRPYLNRAWIIQEVAVAANVKIIFGNVEMRWSTMLPLLEWLEGNEQVEPLRSLLDGALTLSGFRHYLSVSPQSVSLYQALQRSSKSLATDERDRIFALLGVSHDGPALVPLPNYKQSLERILSDMTAAMIRQSRSLDIIFLRRVNLVPDEPRPSWVPDWLHLWDQGRQVPFLEANYEHWKKSYSYSRNPLARRIDQGKIAVRGVLFDIVSTLSTRIASTDREYSQNSSTESGTQDAEQIRSKNRANSNVMWQTICMIQTKLDVASESELEKRGHLLLTKLIGLEALSGSQSGDSTPNAALRQWLRENMSTVFGGYRLQDWDRGSLSSNIKVPQMHIESNRIPLYFGSLQSFIERVEKILNSGMRLMSTSEGWLGMAHPNARVGDRIAYLQGCSVPVTLRNTTTPEDVKPAFAVVGGVYRHWSHRNYDACRQFVETGLWEKMDEVEELILS